MSVAASEHSFKRINFREWFDCFKLAMRERIACRREYAFDEDGI